ncbi:MAG: B3/B4 domain-containing protein [Candidatus Adiutrix sp.]
MRYFVTPQVFEKFPNFRRAVVVAKNINNFGENPELSQLLQASFNKIRTDEFADYANNPRLTVWVHGFASLGLAKKHKPSVLNMIKRVRSGVDLPFINPLVAIFNCISLDNLISSGGDDLASVKGDLCLGLAQGDENYTPLGQPEVRENPKPGEVIYFDTVSREVFCRAWCWKNGDTSKLLPQTKEAAINIDGMLSSGLTLGQLNEVAEKMAKMVAHFTGAQTVIHQLSPENPSFEINL